MTYVYLIPGIGFGISNGKDKLEVLETNCSIAFLRNVAVCFSNFVVGVTVNESQDVLNSTYQLFYKWLQTGADVNVQNDFKLPAKKELKFDNLTVDESGVRSKRTLDLRTAFDFLNTNSYKIVQREDDNVSKLLKNSLYIYTCYHSDNKKKTVSEGKSFTQEQAMNSVCFEAIERIFSDNPVAKVPTITDSYRSLKESGFDIINFELLPISKRDLISEELITDWIWSIDINGNPILFPVELVFFEYIPQTRIIGFSYRNSTGLAVGASYEECITNGILEVIERDAYWNIMRTKIQLKTISIDSIIQESNDESLINLIESVLKCGWKIHFKLISLDWPIPIIHCVIENHEGKAPAFSHGASASLDLKSGIKRAFLESIQVFSDLHVFLKEYLLEYINPNSTNFSPSLKWSDPLFRDSLLHLLNDESEIIEYNKVQDLFSSVKTPKCLIKSLEENEHKIIFTPINTDLHEIKLGKVFISNTTYPDEKLETHSNRLDMIKKRLKLPTLYDTPILS